MERTFDLHQQNKSISKRPKLIAALKKGDKTVAELAEIGEVSTGRIREYFYGGAIIIKDGLGSLSKKFKLVDKSELEPKGPKSSRSIQIKSGSKTKGKDRAPKKASQKSNKGRSGEPSKVNSKDKTTKKVDLKK